MKNPLPTIEDVKVTRLQSRPGETGQLGIAECSREVPFDVRRVFYITKPVTGANRGHHAHKRQHQFLICLAGAVELVADDGKSRRTIRLSSPEEGVHVPPGIWAEQSYKTGDSVLLVLTDAQYDEDDYIRDRKVFQHFRDQEFPARVEGSSELKLNLGCGGRPLAGYVNIDQDTIEQLRKRYPGREFESTLVVEQYNIFGLPYDDESVDEVRADALVEHLPFAEERDFFAESVRVLKPGGTLIVSVPDFEEVARIWLGAKDDWKDFYRTDDEAIEQGHWFGTYSYGYENRWGYIAATVFGSQNGAGQFHRNAYSDKKLRAIARHFGLEVVDVEHFQWQGDRDPMLRLIARKPRVMKRAGRGGHSL